MKKNDIFIHSFKSRKKFLKSHTHIFFISCSNFLDHNYHTTSQFAYHLFTLFNYLFIIHSCVGFRGIFSALILINYHIMYNILYYGFIHIIYLWCRHSVYPLSSALIHKSLSLFTGYCISIFRNKVN